MLHFNAAPAVKTAALGDEDVYKVLILDRHTKVDMALRLAPRAAVNAGWSG